MFRTQVVEIELTQPIAAIPVPEGYQQVRGLVRWSGAPLGYVYLPGAAGQISPHQIIQAVLQQTQAIGRQIVLNRLADPDCRSWHPVDLLQLAAPPCQNLPSVTVILCPNSGNAVTPCLDALQQSDYVDLEVLIVTPEQDHLLWQPIDRYDHRFRWLSIPDANTARNFAMQQAQGEILLFLDQRSVPLPDWVTAMARAFVDHPQVSLVTGLVIPDAIETEAQQWFEQRYSLDRGFERRWYRIDPTIPLPWPLLGTMQIGSGANLAMRRSLLEAIGGFDPALEMAQITTGGSDLDLLCRTLLSGETILYEPGAIVRYHAPSTESDLSNYAAQSTIGLYACIEAGLQRYPHLQRQFFTLGLWKLARILLSLLRPHTAPRRLIVSELQAIGQGRKRYKVAQQAAQKADQFQTGTETGITKRPDPRILKESGDLKSLPFMSVQTIEVNAPLPDLPDAIDYKAVRVFVTVDGMPIGSIDIENRYAPISRVRLQQAIAAGLTSELLASQNQDTDTAWLALQTALKEYLQPALDPLPALPDRLPAHIPVSIVITTCDRPADLTHCLRHLSAQQTDRPVEIIVADNRPASGLTPPVVAQFPGVKLVSEARPGGAYGRNAAIVASTGEIIVTVDDDVTVPPDWLEKLIAPLVRSQVMVVTGNVLPQELETPAQLLFEQVRGGLGAGYKPFEVDGNWLAGFSYSPPVWDLGVSANAAFRASIFSHSQIGLMDEVLGPGTPTVGGEENYLIYKVLKAGYTLVYEPKAYVWHRHRRSMQALYRQIYGHMKGGTAYHLTLWLKEKDTRALRQLFSGLPRYYCRRVYERLRGWHHTPWRFLWSEITGYLAGFWGYWQSCQRVNRQGRSAPYMPVPERISRSSLRYIPETPPENRSSNRVTEVKHG